MGAWGAGYFANDDAGDFITELGECNDWALARRAFEIVAGTGSEVYLELTPGAAAVVAAAVFAQKSGKIEATDFPDDIEIIAALPAPPNLAALALRALARVRGPNSEIAELWIESGDKEWLATLDALEAALR